MFKIYRTDAETLHIIISIPSSFFTKKCPKNGTDKLSIYKKSLGKQDVNLRFFGKKNRFTP